MSVKNYTNFLLSPGDYNFKINYLKDKMGHGVQVHILLNNLASVHSNISIALVMRSKCYERAVKLYPESFEFKVFMRSNTFIK